MFRDTFLHFFREGALCTSSLAGASLVPTQTLASRRKQNPCRKRRSALVAAMPTPARDWDVL